MKWQRRISSLFLIGFSVFICFLSLDLGIGNPKKPGPGAMPFLASILVFSLSLLVLIIERETPKEEDDKLRRLTEGGNLLKIVIFVVMLIGYTFLINIIGFLITSFVLVFGMLSITEGKKWHKNMLIAAIMVVTTFLVFNKLLGVHLPSGVFRIPR
jgi:putative tricarboxylic transport membrane protein